MKAIAFSGTTVLIAALGIIAPIQIAQTRPAGNPQVGALWSDTASISQNEDAEPPILLSRSPEKNATGISLNTAIRALIVDAETGVDSASLKIRVNGIDITTRTTWSRYADINYSGYLVSFQPLGYFNFGELVTVSITASDRSAKHNTMTEAYSFTCLVDSTPPAIVRCYPVQSAFANTPVILAMQDSQSGVDADSIVIFLQDKSTRNLTFEMVDSVLIATWMPSPWFEENSLATVGYSAVDYAGNSIHGSFSFWIEADVFVPAVHIVAADNNDGVYAARDTLVMIITDKGLGLSKNSLIFSVDGQDQLSRCRFDTFRVDLTEHSSEYHLKYALKDEPPGKIMSCRVVASDHASPSNRTDTSFVVQMALPPHRVEVIPPLITPNGDGINDRAYIYVNMGILPERIRIFSLGNELVQELDLNHGYASAVAEWDGRNRNNQPARCGVYIVQITAENKSYQCSITVAR